MLAASTRVSNVPPDNLQPPPVVAFPTRSPQQLGANRPILPVNTNPGPMAQQQAAGQKPRPDPLAIPAEHPDLSLGTDSEGLAIRPCDHDAPQLPAAHQAPGQGCRKPCREWPRQCGQCCNTDEDQRGAGPGYTSTQARVRTQLGEVCVRWHAQSVPTMGLVAATGTHSGRDRQGPELREMPPYPHRCPARSASRDSRAEARRAPACRADIASGDGRPRSVFPLRQHPLGRGNGLRRVEALRACLRAVHDRVTAIEPERILERVETLAGGLVTRVDEPAVGGQ